MKCRSDGSTQQTSSLKAGFSVRSGRGLENGGRTVAEKGLRAWKTRKNPFTAIFESEIELFLTVRGHEIVMIFLI